MSHFTMYNQNHMFLQIFRKLYPWSVPVYYNLKIEFNTIDLNKAISSNVSLTCYHLNIHVIFATGH